MALPLQQTQALIQPGPEVTVGISRLEHWSKSLQVRNADEYKATVETIKDAKAYRANIVKFFADNKANAYKTWKGICEQESAFLKRIDSAEAKVKQVLIAFQQEQERIRQAEQRRLQAEADERARKEQEKLMARAEKAEASGKDEKAEALREQAAAVQAPVVEVSAMAPKVAGVATKTNWKARVVNADLVPREYMVPNMDALNAIAKSTKGSIKIPGVEMYAEQSLAIGGR